MFGRARVFVLLVVVAIASATLGLHPAAGGPRVATLPTVVVSHFYEVPDPLRLGAPGDVIKRERIDIPGLDGSAWRVMYHSRSIAGRDIAVTGFVMVPPTRPPKEGYPVITWAHGTVGVADTCAPSRHLDRPAELVPLGDELLLSDANQLLAAGYLLVRTDYEGLGTPGRHPFAVGISEARSTIDAVRAARNMPQLHASDSYVVLGHSQGGQATLFVMQIADQWAPEIHLLGAVAEAPPSQLELIPSLGPGANYLVLLAAAGFNAAYGDQQAPLDEILTPLGQQFLADVDRICQGELSQETAALDPSALFAAHPATIPAWDALLQENDPGKFETPSSEPLLIVHGSADQNIPAFSSQLLFSQLCAIGQNETRWVYPGINHPAIVDISLADVLVWVAHRFSGLSTPDAMTPTAVQGTVTKSCP